MHLKTYIEGLPRGGAAALAAGLGISTVYLSQLAARQDDRQPSPELCVRIETATFKHVRRWDLRHDWPLIWPELIRDPDAPKPESANDGERARA